LLAHVVNPTLESYPATSTVKYSLSWNLEFKVTLITQILDTHLTERAKCSLQTCRLETYWNTMQWTFQFFRRGKFIV
jgi:hypothetical protein